jgi:hypothetical protein
MAIADDPLRARRTLTGGCDHCGSADDDRLGESAPTLQLSAVLR